MRAITLVFLFACIAYSQSGSIKTAKEIQDFEKYLRNSVNGKSRLSSTPELDNIQTPWSRSGKFEGDILLDDDQINNMVDVHSGKKNAVTNPANLWPNKLLYYYVRPNDFSSEQVQFIRNALNIVEAATCVRFQQLDTENVGHGYVHLTGIPDGGCNANVGYLGNRQIMNLQPNGCLWTGTVIHEFMHALGFWHMHSTHDRDDFVRINWNNIIDGYAFAFDKYPASDVTNLGLPYDYVSIMHYNPYDFSISSSLKTIEAHDPNQPVGSGDSMTGIDIARIRALYSC